MQRLLRRELETKVMKDRDQKLHDPSCLAETHRVLAVLPDCGEWEDHQEAPVIIIVERLEKRPAMIRKTKGQLLLKLLSIDWVRMKEGSGLQLHFWGGWHLAGNPLFSNFKILDGWLDLDVIGKVEAIPTGFILKIGLRVAKTISTHLSWCSANVRS